MVERTINGKKIGEVFAELRKDFLPKEVKIHDVTKKPYVSVSLITERLDSVLSPWNWSFTISNPCIWITGEEENCVLSGIIKIYDDSGNVFERSAAGAATIIYPKNATRPKNVANSVDTASKDVLKRCAKLLGIGKNLTVDTSSQKGSEEVYTVELLSAFVALSKGGAKVEAYSKDIGNRVLIIYKNNWDELCNKYPDSFGIGKKLNELNFIGKLLTYNGQPQVQYVSLPKKNE